MIERIGAGVSRPRSARLASSWTRPTRPGSGKHCYTGPTIAERFERARSSLAPVWLQHVMRLGRTGSALPRTLSALPSLFCIAALGKARGHGSTPSTLRDKRLRPLQVSRLCCPYRSPSLCGRLPGRRSISLAFHCHRLPAQILFGLTTDGKRGFPPTPNVACRAWSTDIAKRRLELRTRTVQSRSRPPAPCYHARRLVAGKGDRGRSYDHARIATGHPAASCCHLTAEPRTRHR
jgi:hypothetical protein